MFRKLKRRGEADFPTTLDPHVTSPGQDEPVIVRNDSRAAAIQKHGEIYERARQIFDRAKRSAPRRAAGII